ncbi:TPA: thioredoxin [Candidatus Collierbacteria bacterium]|uniref:Thioredoxin n=1 Tax=Candidatus Collierbacteria bacterium GW2011_GWB2_44_22 TaxID=1618387 RepID=A0A0G1K679_9BACT|nr:MAG: Thioredoxin [Candidatus Collierbacteria bacterium GW2011_GWA2_44_13]KKT49366.1 MAG: Thioredoxin [Candidatus Collierbacteria bacterium GW2011_GWB1_44_197]KKT51837.1 MAG: Thioredoxin [Candidatus Collierbacteria bacterium GW2011_GWB2_44_22]KKT61696.1 MAG: Thioredoxin [Candidatus Collierbacteria bacterium GW2011_GWD1_44_27]KKT65565.1 MAG: Thioredoxin [Candidatus Collierbacteria bacterium GW2011_GWC2_44_30]KKT68662.1 MAG: Thioredoxin [Microgenomates group bacterium GW2011_GWC1_44_37]HCQ315
MTVVKFTDQNFNDEVLKSETPVLVDFYADWCGPCRLVSPIVDELANTYEGKIKVGKVDVDANSKIAGDYGVMSIPTVILYQKGKEVARQVGFGGKDAYIQMIEKVIK